jgi:hypothetical protein
MRSGSAGSLNSRPGVSEHRRTPPTSSGFCSPSKASGLTGNSCTAMVVTRRAGSPSDHRHAAPLTDPLASIRSGHAARPAPCLAVRQAHVGYDATAAVRCIGSDLVRPRSLAPGMGCCRPRPLRRGGTDRRWQLRRRILRSGDRPCLTRSGTRNRACRCQGQRPPRSRSARGHRQSATGRRNSCRVG